jgi:Ca2+-binding EF-hand superfamily protein
VHRSVAKRAQLERSVAAVCEFLHRHRFKLDALFSYFDRDGTGQISIEQFREGVQVLRGGRQ